MNNVSNNKKWNEGTVQVHVEPYLIPPIKHKNDEKSDKYFVTIKLRKNPTSEKLDLYELKMSLFDNSKPEYFLLFVLKCITDGTK